MDSCLRLHGGQALCGGVRGWVRACVFMGVGPRMREDNGWGWILACVFTGVGPVLGGTGMGPRMREDNGWGWILACVFAGVGSLRGVRGWVPACARTTGGGWILACVFMGEQRTCAGGYGDGSPHARGQREGMEMRRERRHDEVLLCYRY